MRNKYISRAILLASCLCASPAVFAIVAQTAGASPPPRGAQGPVSVFTVSDGETLRKGEFTFSGLNSAREIKTEKLPSKMMKREMPYRVVLPSDYSAPQSAKRYPVVYLLHGLSGHYDNWTDRTKLAESDAGRGFIIVTPEGENGWYTDSASTPDDKYESYILRELIPEIDKRFRTIPDRGNRAIAGLSMGGFGAVKFGLKYPEMFSLAGSFSGALGAASITEKQFPGAIGKTIDAIFGVDGSDTRKSNDPFDLIRRATSDKIKAFPFLYLDCGTEDFLFKNNQEFIALLLEKDVPHEFRHLPGGHNWTYWNSQVEEFLEVAEKRLTTSQNRER